MKKKQITVVVGSAIASMALFAASSGAVFAEDETKIERVEITGSSISRIAAEGALPVQTYSHDDIQRSGATSVADFLQNLTSVQGFTSTTESVGGGGGGFSGASVHGIGETRTLVLLNGRRIASWAGQTLTGAGAAIDLNSLPLSVVDRVEVLTDGASALYGSDAIAGVVNFILKTNMTDWNVSANVSIPKGSVGKQTSVSLSKGFGDLHSDGYNVMFSYSRDHTDAMKATDRNFSKTGAIPFKYQGQDVLFLNASFRGAPANFFYENGADPWGNPYYLNNGTCPDRHFEYYQFCLFDYASTVEINPEQDRDSVLLSFSKALAGNHTMGADLVWNRYKMSSTIAPAPIDLYFDSGVVYDNFFSDFPSDAGYGDPLYAYWRAYDGGGRVEEDITKAGHLALWLKGSIGPWDYRTSYTHSTNKWVQNYPSGWFLQSAIDDGIANGTFDPFAEMGGNDPAVIASMQFRGQYKSATSSLDVLELGGSREIFSIDNRPVMLGLGVDYKKERVKYTPSETAQGLADNIAGDRAEEVGFDVSRKSWGAFAELNVPLAKTLEMTGSLRHDHYEDFGNTDNYKISARYQPSKTLLFRASAGTGFRAPAVPQVAAGRQLYGVTGNQYSCTDLASALAYVQLSDPSTQCYPVNIQYNQVASGNPDLKPEESTQWALGFQIEPMSNLVMGADWWNVNIKDRIGQLAEDTVAGNVDAYLDNFTSVTDPYGNHYLAFYLPNENLGKEKFSGIDAHARMVSKLDFGKLTTTFKWTHMLKHDYQREPGGAFFSDLGKFNDDGVMFNDILRLSFNLAHGSFAHTLTMNYKSGYRDYQCSAAVCGAVVDPNDFDVGIDVMNHHVDAYVTYDWQTQYQINKMAKITAGVLNILDTDPPFTIKTSGGHQIGYDNRYTDPRGRTLYLGADIKF